MADAAGWGAVLAILMKLYPDKVSQIMSWTELFFGLGYTIGKTSDMGEKAMLFEFARS